MGLVLLLRCVVVPLLMFAAASKLQSLINDTLYFGQFDLSAFSVAVVEFAIVAVLVLEGASCFAWQSAGGLFCVFAVINVHNIFLGQKSCGCLGDISLQAKWMLVVDLVIAIACGIAAFACSLGRHRSRTPFLDVFSKSAKLTTLMLFFAVGLCALQYAGARYSLFAGPGLVSTSQPVKSVIDGSVRKSGVIQLPLANPTAHEISVVGVHLGCDSELLSQLPVTIQSGAAVTLNMVTALPDYAGESKMVSTFYVAGGPVLEQRIVVRVQHD